MNENQHSTNICVIVVSGDMIESASLTISTVGGTARGNVSVVLSAYCMYACHCTSKAMRYIIHNGHP